jgi:hypothetical protein
VKVVGIGSVGTRWWSVCFSRKAILSLLQFKEARTSVLAPYAAERL